MVKPITPDDIPGEKEKYLPSTVIETFNELITKYYFHGRSRVPQDEAVNLISNRMGIGRQEVFDNKYLEVEDMYKHNGWNVEYYKPTYNETNGYAYFTFTKDG